MGYQILQIFKLERVQNAAARLIMDISKFSDVTVLLSMNFMGFLLHVYQIKFKILTLTSKSIHGLVPSNLSDLIKVKQRAHEQLFLMNNYSSSPTLAGKMRFSDRCFGFQSRCFSLLVGITYSLVVA